MNLIKKRTATVALAAAMLVLYSFTEKGMEHAPVLQNNDWVAPKSADNLKNPFKGDETAIKKGKITYQNITNIIIVSCVKKTYVINKSVSSYLIIESCVGLTRNFVTTY